MGKNNRNKAKAANFHNGQDGFKIKTIQPNNGVKRPCPDTSGNTTVDLSTSESFCTDDSLHELTSILKNIERSGDENKVKEAVNIIFQNQTFKNTIYENIQSKISSLEFEIVDLQTRMDDIEQYSRRNCLKFSGIHEERNENTDKSILNIVNKIVLKDSDIKLDMSRIDRTHRVGPERNGRPRDIVVKFLSYRDRDVVFRNKKNLKSFNRNPSNRDRVFINEALTRPRAKLFAQARRLQKENLIESTWTIDGRIKIKQLDGKVHTITREEELIKSVPRAPSELLQASTPKRY